MQSKNKKIDDSCSVNTKYTSEYLNKTIHRKNVLLFIQLLFIIITIVSIILDSLIDNNSINILIQKVGVTFFILSFAMIVPATLIFSPKKLESEIAKIVSNKGIHNIKNLELFLQKNNYDISEIEIIHLNSSFSLLETIKVINNLNKLQHNYSTIVSIVDKLTDFEINDINNNPIYSISDHNYESLNPFSPK